MTRAPLDYIPPADVGVCSQCSDPLDVRAPGVAQRVLGWRVNRAQGGANMIALAEPQGVYLCRHCLDRRRAGAGAWDQPTLWEP